MSEGFAIYSSERVRGRNCGSCKLCCILMPVLEIDKEANMKCEHLCSKGCNIYPGRPRSCSTWSCRWLIDKHVNTRRPDQAGYLIDSIPETIKVDGREVDVIAIWVDSKNKEAYKDPALLEYLTYIAVTYDIPALIRYSSDQAFALFAPQFHDGDGWHEAHGPCDLPADMNALKIAARVLNVPITSPKFRGPY